MTKVSTITPCYNMSKYMKGFLDNLSTQTHKDLEIVLDHNEPSDEEINLVAQNAGVKSFSEELDQKLHTVIGENGIKLSGGQRQRIAIARALIKDAPLLIMDEATSSLDNITENKIHETINSLMNNKTKLIIAHRLSTIEDADIIYVLDKGKIESQGKHEELISKSTIYKKLQLREQLENEF